MSNRYWLLLEKSDETRISKGIDGYQDKTGELYCYDSLVPNHRQLDRGDCVVLRKEDDILGVGRVASISESPDAKIHRRCPKCRSTDIRERRTRTPKWKCGKCANEFSEPEETTVPVRSFKAHIENFTRLNSPPSVSEVKHCVTEGDGASSQLSILELDPRKIQTLLEGTTPSSSSQTNASGKNGQGFGLSQTERKQVELRAMRVARELYESNGWKVVDTSGSHPYDLLATLEGLQRFIEVKGTVGEGNSIILTHGEVKHVRQHRRDSALVVVSRIVLTDSEGGCVASGGEIRIQADPWVIDELRLEPTEYRYAIAQDRPNNALLRPSPERP